MKKSKIIAPALGVLILSTAASISGTVAWFTANSSVSVTGMVVHTSVSSNILVSEDNTIANFRSDLTQSQTGLLEPVSTVDGATFHYTTEATADGAKISEASYVKLNAALTPTSGELSAFNTAYGTSGAVGFIDYSFYLQVTNTSNDPATLGMTTCNFLYDGDGEGAWQAVTEKAWRVALFAAPSAYTSGATTTAVTDESCIGTAGANRKTILAMPSAQNQTNGKAVGAAGALADVTYGTAATIANDIASGATVYYKVVVRLWLEGEDKTCTSTTFADLTNNYKLDLAFTLAAGVTAIGSVVPQP